MLFKITLNKYNYIFITKGVQKVNKHNLVHKIKIYSHLMPLQGKNILVCLGSIALT